MQKVSRNYGIDVLRIVSMMGVVLLHVLGHGGILESAVSPTEFSVLWFAEVLAYPAVNCFVLMAGYVGYRDQAYYPRLKNIVSLFLTVLFYSVVIALIFKAAMPSAVGVRALLKACIPVTAKQYWFFTAYFGMLLFSPMLHLFVHRASKKQMLLFMLAFALLDVLTVINDAFVFFDGYSVIWFMLLYAVGAAIRKYEFPQRCSKWALFGIATVALVITWLSKTVLHIVGLPFENALIAYTSPTVVVGAICLLCLFSKMTCRKTASLITFFSTSTFSVYLIHDNVFIREHLMPKLATVSATYPLWLLVLFVCGAAVGIFLCCVLIDKVRLLLFRLMRADVLCTKAETMIKHAVNTVCKRIQ